MLNYQRLNHHFFRPNPHFWGHRTGAPSSLNSRCPFCRTLSGLLPPSGDTNPVAGQSPSSMTVACAEEIVRTRWWIFRLLWLIYRMVNMVLWWFVGKTRAMVYECLCNQNIQEEMELHQIYIPRRNWNQPGKLQITRNYVGTWPEKMKMWPTSWD